MSAFSFILSRRWTWSSVTYRHPTYTQIFLPEELVGLRFQV